MIIEIRQHKLHVEQSHHFEGGAIHNIDSVDFYIVIIVSWVIVKDLVSSKINIL